MKIEDKLVASVISGLKALYSQEAVSYTHLTLVVFPFLKMSRKGPEQTAQEIGEYLKVNEPAVAAFNVIKGFLNLTIASATWIDLLNEIQADEQYGLVKATISVNPCWHGRNMETVKPRKLPAKKVTTSLAIIMYLSISIIKRR